MVWPPMKCKKFQRGKAKKPDVKHFGGLQVLLCWYYKCGPLVFAPKNLSILKQCVKSSTNRCSA